MFSGLVEAKSQVKNIEPEGDGISLSVERPSDFDDLKLGDSIANDGCCLTVVQFDADTMTFQAGDETLSKTTLGQLTAGSFVNCERSLKLGDRIGGHLVSGHVDGVGRLISRKDHGDWSDMLFGCAPELLKQMAPKASVAVNGVSLTLVDVTTEGFSVALIPHTLEVTTLGGLQAGSQVNIETDILAKYVQSQLQGVDVRKSQSPH